MRRTWFCPSDLSNDTVFSVRKYRGHGCVHACVFARAMAGNPRGRALRQSVDRSGLSARLGRRDATVALARQRPRTQSLTTGSTRQSSGRRARSVRRRRPPQLRSGDDSPGTRCGCSSVTSSGARSGRNTATSRPCRSGRSSRDGRQRTTSHLFEST